MFSRLKLSGKIVGTIVVVLDVTSIVSFWIIQYRVNQQAERGFRDKVRRITGMAGATQHWFFENLRTLLPDGNFRDLTQVPVVAEWQVAETYADKNRMKFRTPSLSPGDSGNQPDEFERRALGAFENARVGASEGPLCSQAADSQGQGPEQGLSRCRRREQRTGHAERRSC
jgi:Protein of unknown function (DUF3365)